MSDEDYNASDPEKVAARRREGDKVRKQELEDLRTLMRMPAGVRFLRRILELGHIFHTTFTGNSETYFREGARNLALKVFADVCEAVPDQLVNLMTPQAHKEK
jgi:hypothetical protein